MWPTHEPAESITTGIRTAKKAKDITAQLPPTAVQSDHFMEATAKQQGCSQNQITQECRSMIDASGHLCAYVPGSFAWAPEAAPPRSALPTGSYLHPDTSLWAPASDFPMESSSHKERDPLLGQFAHLAAKPKMLNTVEVPTDQLVKLLTNLKVLMVMSSRSS